jgi:hypothetical protein
LSLSAFFFDGNAHEINVLNALRNFKSSGKESLLFFLGEVRILALDGQTAGAFGTSSG